MTTDTTDADASNDGTRRRTVLAGITGVAGAALDISGVAGADAEGERIPVCDPGCDARRYCCEYDGSECLHHCWLCAC